MTIHEIIAGLELLNDYLNDEGRKHLAGLIGQLNAVSSKEAHPIPRLEPKSRASHDAH